MQDKEVKVKTIDFYGTEIEVHVAPDFDCAGCMFQHDARGCQAVNELFDCADGPGNGYIFKPKEQVVTDQVVSSVSEGLKVKSWPLPINPSRTSMILSTDAEERKNIPITSGVLDYFPRAIAAIAACSKAGNDQHNPGQPLHWDKTKSTDHADCIARHLIDRNTYDTDGIHHSVKLAWRALANLEIRLENEARGTESLQEADGLTE